MRDNAQNIKVVDGVLLLKKYTNSDNPDSDEAILYTNTSGDLVFKNQDGEQSIIKPTLTEITESTTLRTLSLNDVNSYIRLTNASDCAITLPPDSVVSWPNGATIYFRMANTGIPTISGSGVTINGVDNIPFFYQDSTFAIRKTNTTNVWDLV